MAITTNFSNPVETVATNSGRVDITLLVGAVKKILTEYETTNSREVAVKIDEDVISSTQLNEEIYNINSDYNFYTDFYEDITKQDIRIAESGLPNLYIYGDDLNKQSDLYSNIITARDIIQIKATNTGNLLEYFDNYAEQYAKSLDNNENQFVEIAQLEQNIYFTKKLLSRIDDVNKNTNTLPFSIKIDFENPAIGPFASILEGTDFLDDFCSEFVDYSKKNFTNINLKITSDFVVEQENTITLERQTNTETVLGKRFTNYNEFSSQIRELINNYNVNSIFRLGDVPQQDSALNTANSRYGTPVGATRVTRQSRAIAKNQSSSIARSIKMAILMTRLSQVINKGKLTPQQFFSGQPFYSELFMTEINKQLGQEIIQSFYIPNITEDSQFTVYDTQVKFGQNYIYSFNDFYLSLEQELNIELINSLSVQQWITIFEDMVRIEPKYEPQIIAIGTSGAGQEIELTENFLLDLVQSMINTGLEPFKYYPVFFKRNSVSDNMAVFDHPPPPPEVQIDGLIGIDNKIFIQLNSSVNEFKAVPVLIQQEDKVIFDKNVLSQKLESIQDEMMFDGDDRPLYFQIFRLDFHPNNYFEFKNNYVTASTTIQNTSSDNISQDICSILKTNHSTYLDTIEPNKEYYYMFRTVDIHGNISNPSPIYEVIVINQEGTIYPLIKVVDLKKPDDKTPFKSVRRFLHIIPNALQTIVNEQESNYYNEDGTIKETADDVKENVVLGLTDEKVWNKNYRLKIKSKTTGKIIEIDFKFKHNSLPNAVICK